MADSHTNPTLRFVARRGSETIHEDEITEPSVTIGRGEQARLVIDDPSVGQLHAIISVEDDGTLRLMDVGAPTGTRFRGESIANTVLPSGETFDIGDVSIEVTVVGAANSNIGEAGDAASSPSDDIVGDPIPALEADEVMSFVLRPREERGGQGVDMKAPRVLEVHQVWQNVLLDTKHFQKGRDAISVGASVGWRWNLLGIDVGWVPAAAVTPLKLSPPIWSDVRSEWRTDFYTPNDSLPGGIDWSLFQWDGSKHVARIDDMWSVHGLVDGQRVELDALVEQGRARRSGRVTEIPVTDDLTVVITIGDVTYVGHTVYRAKAIVAPMRDQIDYPFLSIFSFLGFLGLMFGLVMYYSPPPAEGELVEIPDHFVELLLEKPEKQIKKDKPAANPDAGEGEKAKKEEGKTGKKDAKMKKAKGNKRQVEKAKKDREVAESAGVLGALQNEGFSSGIGAEGLGAQLSGGIGGLIGAKGTQIGSGGLGSRGSGLGGGGSADGLGGLGTKGYGSGRSGYGSGGGSFGAKGEGSLSATTGDPIILGALDRSLIDAVIKRKMPQIRYCYQRELQKNPTLAGKLVIKFTIAGDGSVSKAAVKTSTVKSPAVENCVVGRFYKMTFPEPKGGGIVLVSYPFIFSPG